MLQQRDVDLLVLRLAPAHDPRDLLGLPVDHARQDQRQAATRVHLLVQLAGVDPPSPPVIHVPGQRVQLLDLQQAPPDARPQLRLGQIAEQELGLEDPAQVAIGPVEAVLGRA